MQTSEKKLLTKYDVAVCIVLLLYFGCNMLALLISTHFINQLFCYVYLFIGSSICGFTSTCVTFPLNIGRKGKKRKNRYAQT